MTTQFTTQQIAEAFIAHDRNQSATAVAVGCSRETVQRHLRLASEQGLLGTAPVLPGFRISKLTSTPNGDFIQQKPELGPEYTPTDGLGLKGKTTWVGADGRVERQVFMERSSAEQQRAVLDAIIASLKEELPRVAPVPLNEAATLWNDELLNQYTVTDNHFGMLSWREETGADYDLRIAEALLLDWFAAAIQTAPNSHTAVLAQLGDLLHHDGLESVTPTSNHVLDADSRLQKVIRVVIRCFRRIIDMLLAKHQHVHVVMASGNHDPASSAWLRELFATLYENEPRVTVDTSPDLYYAFEWGQTGLYYHHMHKRGVKDLDRTFAGKFREMFGRCRYNYGHGGHLHSDAVVETALMHIERHETLAAPDAYASGGGWMSGRSAKVITYSKRFGEVGRSTLRPEMVVGASAVGVPANDNVKFDKAA
jgi:hypothetical protein